ncbi:putative ragulator complex protein LAMTOR3-A-like isoform X1 [Cryptosporidium canis]|uniref:Ragulator complex protein LAMTOR3-A-like isoform X1 n=1 Tax=Cryptosporidium canis TaxID=195482 RepID=A0ABQ8P5H1_9CRYT|nr:putative ragulator complex protein LAMTOR3-A-like isoform X1 [Cryptosporidium canis]
MDISKIDILDNTINGEDPNVDDYFTFRDLFSTFVSIIQRKRGIESIVVTDHDGVIVLKVASSLYCHKPSTLSISVLVTFASLVSFCEKVEEFGRVSFVIIRTNKESTFQINLHPLIVNIVANPQFEGTSEADSNRPGAPGVGLKLKPPLARQTEQNKQERFWRSFRTLSSCYLVCGRLRNPSLIPSLEAHNGPELDSSEAQRQISPCPCVCSD